LIEFNLAALNPLPPAETLFSEPVLISVLLR